MEKYFFGGKMPPAIDVRVKSKSTALPFAR